MSSIAAVRTAFFAGDYPTVGLIGQVCQLNTNMVPKNRRFID